MYKCSLYTELLNKKNIYDKDMIVFEDKTQIFWYTHLS